MGRRERAGYQSVGRIGKVIRTTPSFFILFDTENERMSRISERRLARTNRYRHFCVLQHEPISIQLPYPVFRLAFPFHFSIQPLCYKQLVK